MTNNKRKNGFTIIEVVLVLAIAGLIFLMVFIALPALQRNQRNTQRKNDIDRVASAIIEYQKHNSGKLPFSYGKDINGGYDNSDRFDTNFIVRYIDNQCKFSKKEVGPYKDVHYYFTDCGSAFTDPDGNIYMVSIKNGNNESVIFGDRTRAYMMFSAGNKCADTEDAIVATNQRNSFIVAAALEGGQVYCADNS